METASHLHHGENANAPISGAFLHIPYFLTFKMSSAEQFKKVHNFERVDSEGCILPDKYCEMVGQDTPIAFAISVFVFPDCSISSLKFLLIISSKLISITQLY